MAEQTENNNNNNNKYEELFSSFPKPDKGPTGLRCKVSPFDTSVATMLQSNNQVEHLIWIVPSGKKDILADAHGLGYDLLAAVLRQEGRVPKLKRACLMAEDVGHGPGGVIWPKHLPPALALALGSLPLKELKLVRTELPLDISRGVDMKFPEMFYGEAKCASLVFEKTHLWIPSEECTENIDLSASIKSLFFLEVNGDFIEWILRMVHNQTVAVTFRGKKPDITAKVWKEAFGKVLKKFHAMCIEDGRFSDKHCAIWMELHLLSVVRDLHLKNPVFTDDTLRQLRHYLQNSRHLECVKITGRVRMMKVKKEGEERQPVSPSEKENVEPTRKLLLAASSNKNIRLFSFPLTDCGVGGMVAEALPTLKFEMLDIGLARPMYQETNPGAQLLAGLEKNTSLGAFHCEQRRLAARVRGMVGMTVRAIKDDGGIDWMVWSHDDKEQAAHYCKRNEDEYYYQISRLSDDDSEEEE